MNTLAARYPLEIETILTRYPPDHQRSAVMPLLYLAQRDSGYLTPRAFEEIAGLLHISPTDVASIAGFYTLYHDQPGAKVRLQVCTDLPCALRGAEAFLEALCENLAITVGETTPDGYLTIERVTCLAGCHHAPLFQVQTGEGIHYFENQTVESAVEVVKQLRKLEGEASQ